MNDNKKIKNFITNWFAPIAFILIVVLVITHMFQKNLAQLDTTVNDVIIGKEGEVRTVTESELKEVLTQSNLYLIDYPHNGYVEVPDSKGNTKYYVAYKGSVKAGIDASEIEYSIDDTNSIISIKLPQVTIDEPIVDAGSMDYIFINQKYNTEDVAQEAYKYAIADLKNQIANDEQLIEVARESAKTTEKALVEPWINQYSDKQYEIKICEK